MVKNEAISAHSRELRERFGKNLRRHRLARRLSQRDIATVNQRTVCAAERAEVNLSIDVMARLALAVGVEVAELLTPADITAPGGSPA